MDTLENWTLEPEIQEKTQLELQMKSKSELVNSIISWKYTNERIYLTLMYWIKNNKDVETLEIIEAIQYIDWWTELPKVNIDAKWKAIIHKDFWRLIWWILNEDWSINLENFCFYPNWWWNIVRLKWGKIRSLNIK